MTRFQSNRIIKQRGNISSTRIRKELALLNQHYDTSFIKSKINGSWGKEDLVSYLTFQIVGEECRAKIIYDGINPPKCWLLRPVFENPQHIYKPDGNLCLYDPKRNEWSNGSHIYNTFVPWCMEWVIFQMIYEETGEWQHPERHPGTSMTNEEIKDFCKKMGFP